MKRWWKEKTRGGILEKIKLVSSEQERTKMQQQQNSSNTRTTKVNERAATKSKRRQHDDEDKSSTEKVSAASYTNGGSSTTSVRKSKKNVKGSSAGREAGSSQQQQQKKKPSLDSRSSNSENDAVSQNDDSLLQKKKNIPADHALAPAKEQGGRENDKKSTTTRIRTSNDSLEKNKRGEVTNGKSGGDNVSIRSASSSSSSSSSSGMAVNVVPQQKQLLKNQQSVKAANKINSGGGSYSSSSSSSSSNTSKKDGVVSAQVAAMAEEKNYLKTKGGAEKRNGSDRDGYPQQQPQKSLIRANNNSSSNGGSYNSSSNSSSSSNTASKKDDAVLAQDATLVEEKNLKINGGAEKRDTSDHDGYPQQAQLQQPPKSLIRGTTTRRDNISSNNSNDVSVSDLTLEQKQQLAEKMEVLVQVKDHWYRARKYPNTFVGREAVDMLVQHQIAKNRQDAVEMIQVLAHDLHLLEHVHRDHDFKDEYLFYKFVPKHKRYLAVGDELSELTMLGNAMIRGNRDSFAFASSNSSSSDELLLPTESLVQAAKMFQANISLKDHVWRRRVYKQTFVGSQAVDYMVTSGMASTRASAVDLGQQLMNELNLFHHVHHQHTFKDEYLFYKFSPESEQNLRTTHQSQQLSLEQVAAEFERGVEVKDHRHYMRFHPNTFVASRAVDFLVCQKIAKSRRDAVRIGNALQDRFNLFVNVSPGYRKFGDDYLLFRFVEPSQRTLPSQCSFDVNKDSSIEMDLPHVAAAFQKGVTVKSNRYRLKTYKRTFVGNEAVDFLVNSSLAPSRKEAVQLGRTLAKEYNLFSHVTEDHEFTDDFLFYRFNDSDGSQSGHRRGRRRSSLFSDSSSSREDTAMPPEQMAQALRDGGVVIADRKYRLKTYKQVFLGTDAVDFLLSKFVDTRQEAVELGRSLAREFDLFQHVTRDHELEDAPLFYQFSNMEDKIRPMGTSALSMGTSKLREIAQALEGGVPVGVHRHRLRTYNETFLGSEAVDFLVTSGFAATRQEAMYIGRAVAEKFNLFEHVTHDHLLCDANLFFRFVKESMRTLWDDEEADEDSIVPIPRFGVVSSDDQWRKRVQAFEVKMMSKRNECKSPFSDATAVDTSLRLKCWAREFRRLDPRYQILNYFHDVAQDGADKIEETGINPDLLRPLLRYFSRASVFTVFRPTSFAAIRRLILGEAVGKGLDIKGKSAKRGKLSGFVPFLQISENRHKRKIRTLPKDGVVRLFFGENARRGRDKVAAKLEAIAEEMIETVQMAKGVLADDTSDDEMREDAMQSMLWDMTNPSIAFIEDYAPKCYGLEIPVRLFWEAYIVRQDISRKPGSEYDTGRPSQPAFQDMNCAALRRPPTVGEPRAVLVHHAGAEDPMSPFNLLMAYEEQYHDRVLPVVSDFDAFLVGTRGVSFSAPLPPDQLDVLKWCVGNIETILDTPDPKCGNWTSRWLCVLKEASKKGFHPNIPKYGFGDPKTYSLMEQAITRLQRQGAVRHGAESVNFLFPQELDEEFLVLSDKLLEQKLPWKYVGVEELQNILEQKIAEGYTFPLNPKWILCDPGWKRLYDKLVASKKPHVQDSLDVWYPKNSGLREQIEAIHKRHPNGFQRFPTEETQFKDARQSGTTAMDLALQNLKEGSLRSHFANVEAIQEET